jgi:HAD superfamily hydrolase (TIGR01509 family)
MSKLPWDAIDTVLLDMDGTLLDLHYDNHFWLQHLPMRYAEHYQLSLEQALERLEPSFHQHAGTLNWYCLDFWSQLLGLPIRQLKQETAHLIALRPDSIAFLERLQQLGKQRILITNAHRDSLNLKLEQVPLAPHFEQLISSHDYGYPKEHPDFWQHLKQAVDFNPERTLFIDDSLPILRSAQRFGIAHLLAVRQPDSRKPPKDTEEFAAVDDYAALFHRP